jgi:hypothetical protein
MSESLALVDEAAKDAAIERLAQQLHFRMEQLDPQDPTEWRDLDDIDKSFYISYVEWLLCSKSDLLVALGLPAIT